MPSIEKSEGVACTKCEWEAEFRCEHDGVMVCGRHRAPHYHCYIGRYGIEPLGPQGKKGK